MLILVVRMGVTVKGLERIAASVSKQAVGGRPPVAQWVAKGEQLNVGEIDIRIDTQGVWYHSGDVIKRQSLLVLFSSILWFESGEYFLVTPVEKLKISVDDVPFLVVLSAKKPSQWEITLNTSDKYVIDKAHPVMLRSYKGQWIPYVNVRYDLWARVNRAVYEQWMNAALDLQSVNNNSDGVVLRLSSGEYTFDVAK